MIRLIPKRRAVMTADADDVVIFGKRQFAIIQALLAAGGATIPRDELISRVWGPRETPADPAQTLRMHINHMRPDVADLGGAINFVAGGYRLTPQMAGQGASASNG